MEKYTRVFLKEDDQRILPGKTFSFDFEYTPEDHKEHRIFFTGEVDNFYYWKSEYGSWKRNLPDSPEKEIITKHSSGSLMQLH